jgi:tetratricopeptide (TPR) repeat protein
MREDRLQESAGELRRACEIAPNDAEAANNLGLVLLRLRDIAGAILSLETAVRVNPKLIKAHFNLAQAYQRAGRGGEAKSETQRAAALTEEQRSLGRAMVLVQAARQQLQSGDSGKALSSLRQAVAESAGLADAHLELGRAILQTGGDPAEAIRQFKLAWNLDPELAEPHYQIGLAMLKTGDKAEALNELNAAASMAPCRIEVMRALGRAALEAGDRTTALRQFRRVLAWDPEDADAREQLAKAHASM